MEDRVQDPNSEERNEPVRSRWTPKAEQILILESIFNSGMVNPPKEETVKIRKLLEKFGSVGDANVFYWFQNRRSRSRRRQRQIQATLTGQLQSSTTSGGGGGSSSSNSAPSPSTLVPSPNCLFGSSSSCGVVGGDLFSFSGQTGLPEIEQQSAGATTSSMLCPSDSSNLHYQSGLMTVFINGVPTEVPRGPLDMKSMFGQDHQDLVLVHSSGVPLSFNEYGLTTQSLQHGQSYFLGQGDFLWKY